MARETLSLPYPLGPNVMGALGPTDWGRELLELKDMSIQSAAQKLSSGARAPPRHMRSHNAIQCNAMQFSRVMVEAAELRVVCVQVRASSSSTCS